MLHCLKNIINIINELPYLDILEFCYSFKCADGFTFWLFFIILDGLMIIIMIILNMALCNTALTSLSRITIDIRCFE